MPTESGMVCPGGVMLPHKCHLRYLLTQSIYELVILYNHNTLGDLMAK